MYLTNRDIYVNHTFYHALGKVNTDLRNEFLRLERREPETIGNISCETLLTRANNHPTALSLRTSKRYVGTHSLKAHHEDTATYFFYIKRFDNVFD